MAIQARCHLLLEVGIQDEQSVLMIIPSDSASDALSEVGIQDDQSVLMIIPSDNGSDALSQVGIQDEKSVTFLLLSIIPPLLHLYSVHKIYDYLHSRW